MIVERVSGPGCLDHVPGEDVELQTELLAELILPLLDQAARGNDQTAFEITAGDQLLDQQAGHDRLAGARVICQQEPQRLAREHLAVDRRDLVRQGLDQAGVDGEVGVEEVRQLDPVGLGHQPEQSAVGVEGPGVAAGFNGQAMLIIAIERGLGHGPAGDAVDEVDGLLAYPVYGDDFDGLAGDNTLNNCPIFQVLKNGHLCIPMDQARPCS